jgi:hypothetical protein
MSDFPATIEQEFRAYQKRLAENPNTHDYHVLLPTREAPERVIQYHYCGKDTFAAVLDVHHNFRSYIPSVSFN